MPEDASPDGRNGPAREISALRGPVRNLPPRALRALLSRVSNRDLAVLVCTPALDRGLLERLGQGLAPAMFDMLRRDCEGWTGAEPAHLAEAVQALRSALEVARGVEELPAVRRSLRARLADWWSALRRPRTGAEAATEFRPFSLFSATPAGCAAFWIPWCGAVRRLGRAGVDWPRLAGLCDPCTAGVLRTAGQWRGPADARRAVAEARDAVLPLWAAHIRLAGLLGEALLREDDPRVLAEALARDLPDPDAGRLTAEARRRLAAYDERHPLPQGQADALKDLLGLDEEAAGLFGRGESKAPFALAPGAPPAVQAVEVLAIRLACRREGFLFIEEAAKTSGDSALADVAEVVAGVDGGGPERLARVLAARQEAAEAAFGLLADASEALVLAAPKQLFRTLEALAGPLDPGLLRAAPPGWSAYAGGPERS